MAQVAQDWRAYLHPEVPHDQGRAERHSDTLLVLCPVPGSTEDGLAFLEKTQGSGDVMPINDAIVDWPLMADHICSLHGEKMFRVDPRWLSRRKEKHGYEHDDCPVHSTVLDQGVTHHYVFKQPIGTSSMLGCLVGLLLGYRTVVTNAHLGDWYSKYRLLWTQMHATGMLCRVKTFNPESGPGWLAGLLGAWNSDD